MWGNDPTQFETGTSSLLRPILCIDHPVAGSDQPDSSWYGQIAKYEETVRYRVESDRPVDKRALFDGNLNTKVGLKAAHYFAIEMLISPMRRFSVGTIGLSFVTLSICLRSSNIRGLGPRLNNSILRNQTLVLKPNNFKISQQSIYFEKEKMDVSS